MEEYIKKLKENLVEYNQLVANYEASGVENLDYEDTEDYGFFRGQSELLEEVITKLESFL